MDLLLAKSVGEVPILETIGLLKFNDCDTASILFLSTSEPVEKMRATMS